MELLNNIDLEQLAEDLYNACEDMDATDYEEAKEQTIKEIENFLYHLKALAQNEYNYEYFKTFYNLLQKINL